MLRLTLLALLLLPQLRLAAQTRDTLKLTLPEAEALFLQRNLSLIAARFNVTAAEAEVQQARYWPNPTFTLLQGTYNFHQKAFFNIEPAGNSVYALDQLILTAGKRSKAIAMQKAVADGARYVFADALRNLKYTLRFDFLELLRYRQQVLLLKDQVARIDTLERALEIAVAHGNLAEKELIRVQSFKFSLESDLAQIKNQLALVEAELLTLLRTEPGTVLWPADLPDSVAGAPSFFPPLDSLREVVANRPDVQLALASSRFADANLNYQRALAIPDVTLHSEYMVTMNGFQGENGLNQYYGYLNVGLAVQLPFFNRNKGNIQAAKARVSAQEALSEDARNQAQNEVGAAYRNALRLYQLYEQFDLPTVQRLDKMFLSYLNNYEKRTINLLEFVDFLESYRDTRLRMVDLRVQRLQAREQLKQAAGIDF